MKSPEEPNVMIPSKKRKTQAHFHSKVHPQHYPTGVTTPYLPPKLLRIFRLRSRHRDSCSLIQILRSFSPLLLPLTPSLFPFSTCIPAALSPPSPLGNPPAAKNRWLIKSPRYKRLEKGSFRLPHVRSADGLIDRRQLAMLLEGVVPKKFTKRYVIGQ